MMRQRYNIIELDTVDSTNDEAKRKLAGVGHLTVITAKYQTRGRGQRDNEWKSREGENLLFSVVLKYAESSLQMPASSQLALSGMVALSVVDMLESLNVQAKIKWPNDIYVGERKVCGVLIENSVCGKYLSTSIVGVGINVNQTEFDEDIPNPVSIAQCVGRPISTEKVLTLFMKAFEDYLDRFASGEIDYEELCGLYARRMLPWSAPEDFIEKILSLGKL